MSGYSAAGAGLSGGAGPAEGADEAEVLVAEGVVLGRGVGEGREELVAVGAGDQVIVPEDADVALAALDGHLVAEATGGVAVDLADADELVEPRAQGAADVVAELFGILVLSPGRPWARR